MPGDRRQPRRRRLLVRSDLRRNARRTDLPGEHPPPFGSRDSLLNPADANQRKAMTLRLSRDEAATWPISRVLYAGPAAYSCLDVLPDGTILCFFESGQNIPTSGSR